MHPVFNVTRTDEMDRFGGGGREPVFVLHFLIVLIYFFIRVLKKRKKDKRVSILDSIKNESIYFNCDLDGRV